MPGLGDIPRAELTKLANANRVKAIGLAFLRPEMGMLLKVKYQRGASGLFLIRPDIAISIAGHINLKAKFSGWRSVEPFQLEISEHERSVLPSIPDGGNVSAAHVVVLDNAVILAFLIEAQTNLGLCLRVGENHAAWLANQVLDARDRQLLSAQAPPPDGLPN